MKRFTDEQIHEIAQEIESKNICFINNDTGEIIFIPNAEMLSHCGISWEDKKQDDNLSNWQKEIYAEVKRDMSKVESWQHIVKIEEPAPHEAFELMEDFVDEMIFDEKLKNRFADALSQKYPFRHFNELVFRSGYRKKWFAFKEKELGKFVQKEIAAVVGV